MHKIDLDCIPTEELGKLYIIEKIWQSDGLDPNQDTVIIKDNKVFKRTDNEWYFLHLKEWEDYLKSESDYFNAGIENSWINNGIMKKDGTIIPHNQRNA